MQLPAYETLATRMDAPHVLVVTLNRPEVLNALNTQMGRDLLDLWTRLTEDPEDVRCVVLTGAGERAFCSGGDLKERNGMTPDTWRRQHELFERQYWTLMDLQVPVIAAVNGHAYAGGLETVLACDFAYAARHARFALTEVTIGIMPGAGGTQNLPRAIGERRAKEVILSGLPFTAAQACEWGLINRVFPQGELMDATLGIARRIAGNAPISVRQAKQSIHRGLQMSLADGLAFEIECYNRMVSTEDRHEGVRAFNEKRKPQFRGR